MNCRRCQFEIEELESSGRLSESARAHLSACQTCRAFHDERQSLRRLIGGLGAVSAPPDFDFQLRARLAAAKETGRNRFSWRALVASAPAIGLAASFALLVAGVLIYTRTKVDPSATENQSVVIVQEPKPEQSNVASPRPDKGTDAIPSPSSEGVVKVTGVPKRSRSGGVSAVRNSARRESSQPGANNQPIITTEMAVSPAPQIVPGTASAFNAGMNPVVELPVRSAAHPMRVFIDDRSGAKRSVTLAPVIFGSQDLTGRNTQRIATTSQGIW
jgi:hypothetical protein